MELVMWIVLSRYIKTLSTKSSALSHHFLVQLLTLCLLFLHNLYLYDFLYLPHIHKPLLNMLHTTDKLLIEDLVVLALWQVCDFKYVFFANESSSKFMPMTVIDMQNLV